ncbi:MAG: hypothetical protein IJ206_13080 [Oscillospiraceae bacterium]|nr:hypothetical protein [Oscillospiraceae bacterium]
MANDLIINGVSLHNIYDVWVSGRYVLGSPARQSERVDIPGRNAGVINDLGTYHNQTIKYPLYIRDSLSSVLPELRDWLGSLSGYVAFSDTFNPDEIRYGRIQAGLEVSPSIQHRAGGFVLSLDCRPERYLSSGQRPVTISDSEPLTNPTYQTARPLLTIRQQSTSTPAIVQVGTYEIRVDSGSTSPVRVDCDAREILGTDPANVAITQAGEIAADYPRLPGGVSTTVRPVSGVLDYKITPRWWRL